MKCRWKLDGHHGWEDSKGIALMQVKGKQLTQWRYTKGEWMWKGGRNFHKTPELVVFMMNFLKPGTEVVWFWKFPKNPEQDILTNQGTTQHYFNWKIKI